MFRFSVISLILISCVVNSTGSACPDANTTSALASYISRYSYSTIRTGGETYLTTDSVKLAWQDYLLEHTLARSLQLREDITSTVTSALISAEENAAIYLMQRATFSLVEPTAKELHTTYNITSATYTRPSSAEIQYYFSRKKEDVTSAPLNSLYQSLKLDTTSETLFSTPLPGNNGITTGSTVVLRGRLNPAIEEQAFELPLKTPTFFSGEHGWYILWVSERNEAPIILPFEKVEKEVREAFFVRRHAESEQKVRKRVQLHVPIKSATSATISTTLTTGNGGAILASVGNSSVKAVEVINFANQDGVKITASNWAKVWTDYLYRRSLIELAKQDGLTSTCLYDLVRDFDFHKKLAALALEEELDKAEKPVTEEELLAAYESQRGRLQSGKQYEVLDFWTTAPESSQYPAKDELYLRNERTEKRMQEFRNIVARQGLDVSQLPKLSKTYGPFQIDDTGVQPQGPRGYLLDTTVQNLKVGEVSSVVSDDQKYHFYLLKSLIPSRPLTFEEAEPQLRQMLEGKRREQLRAQLIEKYAADVARMPDDAFELLNEDVRQRLINELMELKQ